MNRPRLLLLLLFLALAGWLIIEMQDRLLITPNGVAVRSELESRHRTAESVPTPIHFDLLDEVRPLDLIDMTLEFPESILALEGQHVRLVGFMAPYDSLNDMRRCMIVPSYVGCTFCAPPSLTQVVYVKQTEKMGGDFPFIEPPSDVSGILRLAHGENLHEGHRDGFVYVIDEAIVTPYAGTDAPIRAPGHQGSNSLDPAAPHQLTSEIEKISLEELTAEVSVLRELPVLEPIRFERVSAAQLVEKVREEVLGSYPLESRKPLLTMFSLLGFFDIPNPDWGELMTSLNLSQRIAWVDKEGELIQVLDWASTSDPYTRLELVKEIADALTRQHFPTARPPSDLHEDASRAREGIRQGNKQITAFRYARQRNISPASQPPEGLFSGLPNPKPVPPMLDYWYWLPWETGPFFVEARTGATKDLSRIDKLFHRLPETTLELFRPKIYEEEESERDAIPPDFAIQILQDPPVFSGQFGIGGLVPWMMGSLPIDQAKSVCGQVITDRYALWDLAEDGSVLLLETRWPDKVASRRFIENVPSQPRLVVTDNPVNPFSVRVILAETETGRQRLATALSEQAKSSPLDTVSPETCD
ncbi:MAG: DUF3299 domain-containing protein [Verrucomicrobiota bacterium]